MRIQLKHINCSGPFRYALLPQMMLSLWGLIKRLLRASITKMNQWGEKWSRYLKPIDDLAIEIYHVIKPIHLPKPLINNEI